MESESPNPVPPELRVLMDTEIHVENLHSDTDQPKVQEHLEKLPGVEAVSFGDGSVSVRYDAEKVTRSELCAAVTAAGFRVTNAESAPISPTVEPSENEQ